VTRVLQGLARLVVAGLAIEFYLAGAALLGVTPSFEPHRTLGSVLGLAILLLLVLALIARPGRQLVGLVGLLTVLTIVQMALPSMRAAVPAVAALHVVNAAVLIGLASTIARQVRHSPAASAHRAPIAVAGSR
jgi:asparagine N-glycosylation enzyme membrane subunit Stt3